MDTKLNYKVKFDQNKEEKKAFTPKNRTKVSMQSTVESALANKLPQNPAQAGMPNTPNGWGKNQ